MRIVFIYNKEQRELKNFYYLEKLIKKEYPDADVLITKLFVPDFLHNILIFQPQVILGYPLTSWGTAKYYYLLKAIFNCKIVLYRTEGTVNTGASNTSLYAGYDEYGPLLVDGELFWGRKQMDIVAPQLLNAEKLSSLERVKAVGYLRYEALLQNHSNLPERITKRFSSYAREKIITFVTGFQFADYSKEDMLRAGDLIDPSANNNQEILSSLLLLRDKILAYRERWTKAIIDTAKLNPDSLIVVKPHPVEIEQWEEDGVSNPYLSVFRPIDNILFINEPCSTEILIASSAVLVHYGSTCLADTYLLNTFSIEATVEDLMLEFRDNKNIIPYGALEWPSNAKLPVEDVAEFITREKKRFSRPEAPSGFKTVLQKNFNLILGQPYLPSREIIDSIFFNDKFPLQNIDSSLKDLHFFYKHLFSMPRMIFKQGMISMFYTLFHGEWKKLIVLVRGGINILRLFYKGFRVRKLDTI
ncbi:MAG: hypothetical protein LBN96_05850 [Desulfovibrio sp.]|jgi:hypothetical protein|nr:hypothetical protein [Desulfovibrio sp.]